MILAIKHGHRCEVNFDLNRVKCTVNMHVHSFAQVMACNNNSEKLPVNVI